MCLAQGHNAMTLVRLEPENPPSRVNHSSTKPLQSLPGSWLAARRADLTKYKPANDILVLFASSSIKGSGVSAQVRSLSTALDVRIHNVWLLKTYISIFNQKYYLLFYYK